MSTRRDPGAAAVVGLVSAVVVGLDLATKWLARRELVYGEDQWRVEGIIGLELVRNSGVAFGLLEGRWFTLAMILVAVVALIWLLLSNGPGDSWVGPVGAGAMLGGALGNLIDRLPDGVVTDFVAVGPWPRFNVADSALTLGLLILAFQHFRQPHSMVSVPVRET
jgi:signal peptidase II